MTYIKFQSNDPEFDYDRLELADILCFLLNICEMIILKIIGAILEKNFGLGR